MADKNIEKLDNKQSEEVSGGWSLFGTYCSYCGKNINGQDIFQVPIKDSKKVMCNGCYKKQSDLLGPEVAAEIWLGVKPQSKIDKRVK